MVIPAIKVRVSKGYVSVPCRHLKRQHPIFSKIRFGHLVANGELSAVLLFGSFFVWSAITFIASWMRETPPPIVKGWGGDLTAIILGVLAALILMNIHMYLFGVAIIG